MLGIVQDITLRKQAEKLLQESEERFSTLSEAGFEGILVHEKGTIIDANTRFAEMFGYEQAELIGADGLKLIIPEDRDTVRSNIASGFEGPYEVLGLRKDSSTFPIEIQVRHMQYHGRKVRVAAVRDITAHKQAEELIKRALREKEILLSEIHHRVKNNLQVVSGLLGLQAYTMEDRVEPETLALFRESATRIKSMALVHERLQCSSDFAHVDFDHYIRQLADELFQNYRVHSDSVLLDIQTEGVQVSIDQAVPCGLIVNELLSNALKHAFPDGREGRIEVSLKPVQGNILQLGVCDDGVGLPESVDFESAETLGLTIVNSLVGQLTGEMVLDRTQGTCFRVRFTRR